MEESASSWITAPLGEGLRVPEGMAGTHRDLGKLEWEQSGSCKGESAGGAAAPKKWPAAPGGSSNGDGS